MISKLVALATILMVAAGCDKAKEFVRAGEKSGPPQLAPGEELDLAGSRTCSSRCSGRAAIHAWCRSRPSLAERSSRSACRASGWRKFDEMYQRPGKSYSLYQSGVASGTVDVKRGMWSDTGDALYALPGCAALTPMSSVKVNGRPASDFTLEFLASSAPATAKPRAAAP